MDLDDALDDTPGGTGYSQRSAYQAVFTTLRKALADAVKPDRREAWVAERVQEGLDVLVCHPRLVQIVLDLIDFATVCWYETEFSVFQINTNSCFLVGVATLLMWSVWVTDQTLNYHPRALAAQSGVESQIIC